MPYVSSPEKELSNIISHVEGFVLCNNSTLFFLILTKLSCFLRFPLIFGNCLWVFQCSFQILYIPFALKQWLVSYSRRLLSLKDLYPTNRRMVHTIFDGILAVVSVLLFEKIPNESSTFKSRQRYLLDVNSRFNVKSRESENFSTLTIIAQLLILFWYGCCLKLSHVVQVFLFFFFFHYLENISGVSIWKCSRNRRKKQIDFIN